MAEILWLIPAFPLLGFLLNVFTAGKMPKLLAGIIGVGSVGLSAFVAFWVSYGLISSHPGPNVYTQTLWVWMEIGAFTPKIGLYFDGLACVMALVVTGVGFLIHVYSAEYMASDEDYARFFAYMNLFMFSMTTLVLADNLLLLYLGWEGVGLCSYLLIGFWYKEAENSQAAMKAFIVTRIGDTAFALGLFFLFTTFGSLDIQEVMGTAKASWAVGSGTAVLAAALLLGGALGKSAQLPLQTWLPDAMAGPTPVSALMCGYTVHLACTKT